MSKIYLIAGLGADTRLFNNIDLHDRDVVPIDWIEPNKSDTLSTYAQRLIYQYNIVANSVVIGVSLGGILAIEIAKLVPLNKVILISSIKTIDEAPLYFKLFKTLPAYKLVPGRLMANLGLLIKPVFGNMSTQDAWLFNDMLKKSSPVFIKWAMAAVLHWKNTTVPPNVHHIVGDKDLVFNYKRIKNATVIKGGTHIMVFDKAKQINKLLKSILKKK
ncbi:alpha/beta hydrolase [Mucilaginibacter sp.]|uniref:alpha/beta hydrolase n=1 Tax=Mucilaginibacter sp. TaxID=1882438 RepID=UPI0026029900|nr:alpha/beta hydrolase [Mucilaginibacter sp.]MDB5032467.1 alpha/beta fold hydrolase [Mucilaginibacter sp.]